MLLKQQSSFFHFSHTADCDAYSSSSAARAEVALAKPPIWPCAGKQPASSVEENFTHVGNKYDPPEWLMIPWVHADFPIQHFMVLVGTLFAILLILENLY